MADGGRVTATRDAEVQPADERAVKAGATPVLAPVTKPRGQELAYVRDDDGVPNGLCSPWT